MASLVKPPVRYDVLAEALTADGRVVKKVEARADGLADVAEAFKLAAAEAWSAHVPPARVRLTASRAGTVELAVSLERDPGALTAAGVFDSTPLQQSALLDGKTKIDAPPPVVAPAPVATPSAGEPKCPACGKTGIHICLRGPVAPVAASTTADLFRKMLDAGAPHFAPWRVEYERDAMSFRVTAMTGYGPAFWRIFYTKNDQARLRDLAHLCVRQVEHFVQDEFRKRG